MAMQTQYKIEHKYEGKNERNIVTIPPNPPFFWISMCQSGAAIACATIQYLTSTKIIKWWKKKGGEKLTKATQKNQTKWSTKNGRSKVNTKSIYFMQIKCFHIFLWSLSENSSEHQKTVAVANGSKFIFHKIAWIAASRPEWTRHQTIYDFSYIFLSASLISCFLLLTTIFVHKVWFID